MALLFLVTLCFCPQDWTNGVLLNHVKRGFDSVAPGYSPVHDHQVRFFFYIFLSQLVIESRLVLELNDSSRTPVLRLDVFKLYLLRS
jgi:hypothetical protein